MIYVCDECQLGFEIGEERLDAFADRHADTCEGPTGYDYEGD